MGILEWLFIVASLGYLGTYKGPKVLRKYFKNILIGFDNLVNALLLGDPDETLSSRAYKLRDTWGWKHLYKLLERIDPNHGVDSVEWDEGTDGVIPTLTRSSKNLDKEK